MSTAVVADTKTKPSQLEQLKKFTVVVADTGDFESIREYQPRDATTNPSLIYAATQKEQYFHLLDQVLADRKNSGLSGAAQIEDVIDHLARAVRLRNPRDRARTRLDRDRRATFLRRRGLDQERPAVHRALRKTRHRKGARPDQDRLDLGRDRGRRAARERRNQLQSDADVFAPAGGALRGGGDRADLALRRAGFTIGTKRRTSATTPGAEDPGVQSVQEIYTYYKKFGYQTEVMGASFRNVGQILELAGCDLLTISPDLLEKLSESYEPVERKTRPQPVEERRPAATGDGREKIPLSL